MYVYARIIHVKYENLTTSRHICGFKLASPFDEPQQWSEIDYGLYGLLQPSHRLFYWGGTPPNTDDWIDDGHGNLW